MGRESKIEWTHHTFNPWWGCEKVSPGCAHCYAEALDKRTGGAHWGPGVPRRTFGEKHWNEPRRWNLDALTRGVRERVFCASMADVFEEHAPAGELQRLWSLIAETPNLDWLLLTKRADRIVQSLPADWGDGWRNVWLGVSVEDRARAEERIQRLLRAPARTRFLSMEPLLERVRPQLFLGSCCGQEVVGYRPGSAFERSSTWCPRCGWAYGQMAGSWQSRIDWIIVGGESGAGARPMDAFWVRELRDQCETTVVDFFFKQWGGVNKKAAGRELDGRTWDLVPGEAR